MPEWSLSNIWLFSIKYITAVLHLGTTNSTSALSWGPFKQQNHQQNEQKCKHCGTKLTVKRTLICSLRAETRRQSITWSLSPGKCVLGEANFSPLCTCLWMTAKARQVLILWLQIILMSKKFASMKPMNNEDQLYVCIHGHM